MERTQSYKALTYLNLPFIEERYAPGDDVPIDRLIEAQQTEENIQDLVNGGSLGEADAEIDPSHIIPDPTVPNIHLVVAQAQALVEELEENGEEVPDEIRAVANLDYVAVMDKDIGEGTAANA